ncbi:MAG: hypothetical protein ACRDT6_08525 [Micromonosporaceae bacterium]
MTVADAVAGRRRPRPHPDPQAVAVARREYEEHIPSMTELGLCLAPECDEGWPCRRYRLARETLLLAGELQDGPVAPSV